MTRCGATGLGRGERTPNVVRGRCIPTPAAATSTVPDTHADDGGTQRDDGCSGEAPPAMPGGLCLGRAPQEELHAALQVCLREEWQILGPLLDERASQQGLSSPLTPGPQAGWDPLSLRFAVVEAKPPRRADVDFPYVGRLPHTQAVAYTKDGEC